MGNFNHKSISLHLIIILLIHQGDHKLNFDVSDLQFDKDVATIDIKTHQNNGQTTLNINVDLKSDINDPIIVEASHFEKVNNEYQPLMNASVYACNILSRFKNNPLMKIVLNEFLKSSNMPTQCPFKKGKYYLKDFTLNEK
jgi:hypothetical protein